MTRVAADDNPASPQVSVILVVWNSGPTLARCLAALKAQTFRGFEVILSDNASPDRVAQAAAAADPTLRLLENGENLGFAGGVNRGAALAKGRWLALLNPDAYPEPDWLEKLLAGAQAYGDVRCFASRQLMDEDARKLDGLGDVMAAAGFPFRGGYGGEDPGPLAPGEVFSACGGAMLIDRALFLSVGGLDERLFCYCEDVDLGYRLRLQGEKTLVIPDAVVRHEGSASTGGARSDFAAFHGARNRLWVFVKDTPPLLFWATLPLHLAATALLFTRHAMRGELKAPLRGLLAGLKDLGIALKARRETQAARRVSSLEIARAMTWNPADLFGRRVVIKARRPSRPGVP